jgi:hypothetical protein
VRSTGFVTVLPGWLQQSGAQRWTKEPFVTDSHPPQTLSGSRAEARRLLKHLHGSDHERARAAAARFVRLRSFAELGAEALLAARARVRLKHALAVVAEEGGFASWVALKHAFEELAHTAAADPPGFHTPRLDSLLNRWFRDHAEARASLAQQGGYLLPFREHFFVTESEGVRALGLDPDDPDWSAVGFDLARPLERAAYAWLCARRRAAIAAGVGVPSREQQEERRP